MTNEYFEEEEFTSQVNQATVIRIISLTRPYWRWVVGFLLSISMVSALDSYFTFLSKRIIDEGIVAGNPGALVRIVMQYGALILVQSSFVFAFIYLAGVLGERIRYDLRKKMFNHLQELSLAYYNQTPLGWIMSAGYIRQ